ncbi:MAG TPA: serpin family protein [Allosphingosinicella sp.]|nr:serpin family protein [Allosphingosinicella sp.]
MKLLLAAALMGLAGCTVPPATAEAPPQEQARRAPPMLPQASERAWEEPRSVVEGSTQFGIDLYKRLAEQGGNVFLSPTSLTTAFGLAYAGARGLTAEEMRRVVHYPAGESVHGELGALLRQYAIDGQGQRLAVANALWVQSGFPIEQSYLGLVRQHYSAEPRQVDFVRQPARAVAAVNQWAEANTNGRIKGLLTEQNVDALTRLILTNTVYMKADWLKPFEKGATRQEAFYPHGVPGPAPTPGGMEPPVRMSFMSQESFFRYMENGGDGPRFQAVELPYQGEEMSMVIFLPASPIGLAEFERALGAQRLHGWLDALSKAERRNVLLEIPKLKMEARHSLVPELKALGMRRAFSETEADFSGISKAGRLLIDDVLHQTFLEVDEKGTEAAAATAILIRTTSAPPTPVVFRANHPFFFLIRHNPTGWVLFIGRVRKPSDLKQ